MALTIEGATVGYDTDGVMKLLQDIHDHVITEASDEMKNGVEELNTSVDEIWAGKSADQFKQNMLTDITTIRSALDATYDALRSEISQIVTAMSNVDEQLIEKR